METAEAEVVAEETALSEEEKAFTLAKQHLETSLQKWTDITTRDSSIQSTEELIKQKKNELIHTKVCTCRDQKRSFSFFYLLFSCLFTFRLSNNVQNV